MKMKSNEYWKALEKELNGLRTQRDNLSKKIHLMSVELNQHKKCLRNRKIDTNSLSYKMFGKILRELTPDELREYNRIMQKNRRARHRAEKMKEENK